MYMKPLCRVPGSNHPIASLAETAHGAWCLGGRLSSSKLRGVVTLHRHSITFPQFVLHAWDYWWCLHCRLRWPQVHHGAHSFHGPSANFQPDILGVLEDSRSGVAGHHWFHHERSLRPTEEESWCLCCGLWDFPKLW